VILYSNSCPKCIILANKLDERGLEYEKVNDMEIFQEKGFRSMPHLEVDGEIKDFGEAMIWINTKK